MDSAAASALVDGRGREVTYLRLSLTDRCNYRCSYCSRPSAELACTPLDGAEIRRLVLAFARLGIRRVRLTGGEPTLRRDLLGIVEDVRATVGIEEVALTTNGHFLERTARRLRAAGVTRLNVSLDSLDPETTRRLSGGAARLDRILRGIDAAAAARFDSLKVNVVVVRGENDGELGALARLAWRRGAIPRFIELMPFGAGEPVPTAEVKRRLEQQGVHLSPDPTHGWGPAHHMRGESCDATGRCGGLVGFIGALTEGFCSGCNRVRVGADGSLRPCLGGRDRMPLRALLPRGRETELERAIRTAVGAKPERPDWTAAATRHELLPMAGVGG